MATSNTGTGIWAESKGGGNGVVALSQNGTGLVTGSATGIGIYAVSKGGSVGVVAKSKTGDALSAGSESGNGIWAGSNYWKWNNSS